MPHVSDLVLIGATYDPRTKQIRQFKQPRRRNLWIGTIQLRSGMRAPLDLDFVRQHYDAIVTAIQDGLALLQYKHDQFVDADELKILAFGSEEEKQAYEERAAAEIAQESAGQQRVEASRAAGEALVARENKAVLATGRPLGFGAHEEEEEDGKEADAGLSKEEIAEREANGLDNPQNNNLVGSHTASAEDLQRGSDVDGQGADSDPREEGEAQDDDAPEREGAVQPEQSYAGDYQPLPNGWAHLNKAGLLELCEERDIDVRDAPSNKVLRQRLEQYEAHYEALKS
jgi:hypothetical protein